MSIRVGLLGFGRTGSVVAKEIVIDPELSLEWVCRRKIPDNLSFASHALAFDSSFAPFVSFNNLTADYLKQNPVDIIIDFSSTAASRAYHLFSDAGIKIVTAISKYSEDDLVYLRKASEKSAVLYSPNITTGINWLILASKVLKKIMPQADIEIVEEHFRDKSEKSGTALKLARHLGLDPEQHVNSIRIGGVVGKHEVIFGLPHQTIRLTHESISRGAFGSGATFAGKWLAGKTPGLYTMENIFHEKFMKHVKGLEL